jgi:hypothetical protein
MAGKRDGWLEQRLSYLAGELARLKGGVPLRRFLRGAAAAYRRFLHTADPATAFTAGQRFTPLARGWSDLSAGVLVVKRPNPHRTARTLDRHWRQG